MSTPQKYRVIMKVELEGPADEDPEVEKEVMASSPNDALDKARDLVRDQNHELDHRKIWSWTIELLYR